MSSKAKTAEDADDGLKVGCVKSHFLDSGSFTFWKKNDEYVRKHKCGPWDLYKTEEFRQYRDDYAEFVKKHSIAIDLYANIDVIGNPELSWKNLKYLEREHGLHPVPVVHCQTDLSWLTKHIDAGYEIIGLGGLVGKAKQDWAVGWIDRAFELVCDTKDRKPMVKIHGFGVTTYKLLQRYPWYSVDSTSWTKMGAYGGILVPHKRGGKFVYDQTPYVMKVSHESPELKNRGKHIRNLNENERAIVLEWLDLLGLPLGTEDKGVEGEPGYKPGKYGVLSSHVARRTANIYFFEKMLVTLPEYPWAFRSTRQKGFGLL